MHPISFLRLHPLFVFLAVLLIGLAIATSAYRNRLIPKQTPRVNMLDVMNDRQKAVLSEEQDTSRWLLALASGALTATLATRLSGGKTETSDSLATMAAYAAFIVSMYGAFLSHQAKLSILKEGPLDLVYSDLLTLPIQIQVWFFAIGIVALGTTLFRRPKHPSLGVLLLVVILGSRAHAQEFNKPVCVKAWYSDRMGKNNIEPRDTVRFLSAIESRAKRKRSSLGHDVETPLILNCSDVNRVMDNIRAQVTLLHNGPASVSDLTSFLKTLQPEVENPGASVGDSVASLVSLLTPWDKPHGELIFTKPDGSSKEVLFRLILDDVQLSGLSTPYQLRVAAGKHSIMIVPLSGFAILWQDKNYDLGGGEAKLIMLPVKP